MLNLRIDREKPIIEMIQTYLTTLCVCAEKLSINASFVTFEQKAHKTKLNICPTSETCSDALHSRFSNTSMNKHMQLEAIVFCRENK